MSNPKVIAIGCADIHLQHKPPIWRSAEPDWYEAMKRPLDELRGLQKECGGCPILNAGDVFDDWDSLAELINFAIKNIPERFYSIAGQHDLPNHNLSEIGRSAYETLCESETIEDVHTPNVSEERIISIWGAVEDGLNFDDIRVYGFPYGEGIKPTPYRNTFSIALIHQYVWTTRSKYKTVTEDTKVNRYFKKSNFINNKLFGYDVILFGDNHIGFKTHARKTTIVNCGSLMRRYRDQVDYKPKVWLIYSTGEVEPYYLDISKDKCLDIKEVEKREKEQQEEFDMKRMAKQLRELGVHALDFVEHINEYMKKNEVDEKVVDKIKEGME